MKKWMLSLVVLFLLVATVISPAASIAAVNNEIIYDTNVPGYSEFGVWLDSSLPGYDGSGSRYSFTTEAYASWTADVPSGYHEIYVYKVVHSTSDKNVKVDVTTADGVKTSYLDMTSGTSGWVSIGTYQTVSGSPNTVKLSRSANALRTDAVKFVERAAPPPPPTIIDYGDPGYAEFGEWADSSLKGYNGTGTRYSFSPGAYASWTPNLTTGMYEVSIYKVVHSSNDTNAKVEITHADGTNTQYMNLASGTSGWVNLGLYRFNEGNQGFVKSSRSANAFRADAVKFEKIDNPTNASLSQPAQTTDVPVDSDIVIAFSNAMDAATINSSTVVLRDSAGSSVTAAINLGIDGKTLTINPNSDLIPYRTYTVSVGSEVKDSGGQKVYGTTQWTFTTLLDPGSEYIVLEPEDFVFHSGTWKTDIGYGAFGNRFLIGKKDEVTSDTIPASSEFHVGKDGDYRIWIHSMDAAALQGTRHYKASVNDQSLNTVFGDHGVPGWAWEDGGTVHLNAGSNVIELLDTSAFYARIDSIIITSQTDFQPPSDYERVKGIDAKNKQLNGLLQFPEWALTPAAPAETATIENDHVRVRFLKVPTVDGGYVIQNETSKLLNGQWVTVNRRDVPYGYLMMHSAETASKPINFNGLHYLKLNGLNRVMEWMVPSAMTTAGTDSVQVTAENAYAKLTATWQLAASDEDPKVELRLEAKQAGSFALGIVNGEERTEEETESILLPFQYTSKMIPKEFTVTQEQFTSAPVSLLTPESGDGPKLTYGVAVEPSSIPDRWVYADNSIFGLTIRGMHGGVQPGLFAPLFGSPESKLAAAESFEFEYRPVIRYEDWFETYKYVVSDILAMTDYRKNYNSSLTDTIFNIHDLMLNDDASGWDDEAKGHYNMEGRNVISFGSPLAYLQSYLLTEDEDMYERRTIPTLETLLSRKTLHFTDTGVTEGGNILHGNGASPIGGPIGGYGNNTYGGAYEMTRGLVPTLKQIGIDSGIRNETAYFQVPVWHQELALYNYTKDVSYLQSAKTKADAYLNEVVYKPTSRIPIDDEFINISYAPFWNGLLDLYAATNDPKYLDAAEEAVKRWLVSIWVQPPVQDAAKQIDADAIREKGFLPDDWIGWWKGDVKHRLGFPEDEQTSLLQDTTVPAWVPSRVGLTMEQLSTFKFNESANIVMNTWAPDLMRLSQLTGDLLYETFARNAIIGRSENYPGYYMNQYMVHQMDEAFPYKGPDYANIYYHHIPVHQSMLIDYLFAQAWNWSDGQIQFPSVRGQGYAYFYNREYGFEPGQFFGEQGMWPWLKRDLIRVDQLQIDWLAARKDGRFSVALMNEDKTDLTVNVQLGEEVAGTSSFNGTATIYQANGQMSTVQITDGELQVTVPAHGLIGIALDSPYVSEPAFAKVPAQNLFNVSAEGTTAETGPTPAFGKGTVLQIDPHSYYAYVYTTFMPAEAKKAVLYWQTEEGEWHQTEDAVYPFEFSIKVDDVSKAFRYYVKVTDANDNELTSNTAELKPVLSADKTSPVTTGVLSPAAADGQNGWYVHPVTMTLGASDDFSGVAKREYSLDGGSTWLAYTAPVTFNQDGKYTVIYRSTDNAGNVEAAKTIGFNLDATVPTISVSGLVSGTYSDSADIKPILTISDNLSGVDSSKTTVTLDTYSIQQGATIPLYTLPLGSHKLIVTASDMAGNTSSQTVVFQTTTSIQSLQTLVTRFANTGWIDKGTAKSLQDKLAANKLKDFVSIVKAQSGKLIKSQAAGYLLRDAQYLLSQQ